MVVGRLGDAIRSEGKECREDRAKQVRDAVYVLCVASQMREYDVGVSQMCRKQWGSCAMSVARDDEAGGDLNEPPPPVGSRNDVPTILLNDPRPIT